MDALQQKSLQKYADNLAQLITRLSTFYEGTNGAIDEELKILRGHLAGKPDFTLAAVSVQKLNPLLMDGNQQVRHQIKSKVQNLQAQMKTVQQLEGTSQQLRQSIAKLLTNLSLPTRSLEQLFEHLFNALDLFKQSAAGNEITPQPVTAAPEAVSELKKQILAELQQWVDVYTSKKPNDTELAELKKQLMQGVDDAQLLEYCLILIRLIVSETMLDASANGKIVQRIASAIKYTDAKVTESISLTEKLSERNEQQFDQLQEVLGEFNSNVEQQEDVDKLKNEAHEYIGQLRSELKSKQKADNVEQQKLMSLLVDMQEQLSSLQKQTQNYKQRLVQQKASLYTDTLTGVPNRLAYNERAVKAMKFADTQNEALSLAVIDVDHFKSINDKYGHAAGDRTLQMIARTLKKNLRPNEFLARWGGEEFALLMQNQALDGLKERLDELRVQLSELPFKFKQTPVKITASFGASCYVSGESLHAFFERADSALYMAKEQGRNRVIVNQN